MGPWTSGSGARRGVPRAGSSARRRKVDTGRSGAPVSPVSPALGAWAIEPCQIVPAPRTRHRRRSAGRAATGDPFPLSPTRFTRFAKRSAPPPTLTGIHEPPHEPDPDNRQRTDDQRQLTTRVRLTGKGVREQCEPPEREHTGCVDDDVSRPLGAPFQPCLRHALPPHSGQGPFRPTRSYPQDWQSPGRLRRPRLAAGRPTTSDHPTTA